MDAPETKGGPAEPTPPTEHQPRVVTLAELTPAIVRANAHVHACAAHIGPKYLAPEPTVAAVLPPLDRNEVEADIMVLLGLLGDSWRIVSQLNDALISLQAKADAEAKRVKVAHKGDVRSLLDRVGR